MAKNYERITRQEKTVDFRTGEIVKEKTVLQFPKEPAYVKLYFDCLGVVLDNRGFNACFNDMLVEVLKLASYANESQYVVLNSYSKSIICKNTGKSLERLKKAIKIWTDNNILKRVASGTYQINPHIFGKGEWRDIKALRATVDFAKGELVTEREYEG